MRQFDNIRHSVVTGSNNETANYNLVEKQKS